MDSIFKGDVNTPRGRTLAWIDSLFIDHAFLRLAWTNFAAVAPGVLYRCNHPTPGRLRRLRREIGLRTVINLRGVTQSGSYALSHDAAARLGLELHDIALESRGAPHIDRVLRLHGIYRTMERPAILHCKSGADRAGIAAALFILLNDGSSRDALEQLSWRFGHIKQSRTGVLDAFIMRYRRDAEGRKPFLDWLTNDYDPVALREEFRAKGLASFVNDWVLGRE
jgi:protein tyrosine/serine phosphatase